MKTIGFIGLGHMGTPMAKNLLKNGYNLKVFDLSDAAIKDLAQAGAIPAASPAEIAKDSNIVITMLQTGDQVSQCCLDEKGIFNNLNKPDALFIDSSSIDVIESRKLHEQAKSKNIAMLDAPVSGGVAAAAAATLTFMVGGDVEDFKKAKPILSAMGKNIIHAGRDGNGAAAKICNNMLLAISMIGVSEAFVLAEKLGLDSKKLHEISSKASGECWSLTHYCPAPSVMPDVPSSNDYKPGFTANMMLKDLNLSRKAASSSGANTPLGKLAAELYQKYVDEGNGEIDFSGIFKMLEKGENF